MADHTPEVQEVQEVQEIQEVQKDGTGGSDDKKAQSDAPADRTDGKPRRKSKGCSVVELFDPATNVSTVQVFPPRKKKKAVVQLYDPATDTTTTQVFPAKRVRRPDYFIHTFTIDNKHGGQSKRKEHFESKPPASAGGSGVNKAAGASEQQ
eukprot:CAMPEP_0118921872 /NCGR_PEP_ID=MMETSP1169-20130426/1012_1 /TAXON_ID=36882 /ORGANISM="Pyramimonas obovata, Strain CCMP722" /LENGTH=150 /DNA_ID=CAMNT_0006862663 /DNA_START=201 /DNA_END=653 /DNA_ORIENTATION=+